MKNALGPFRAQQLLADKIGQHLAGEDLRQPRVVDPRDLVEDARPHEPFPVHEGESALRIAAVEIALDDLLQSS